MVFTINIAFPRHMTFPQDMVCGISTERDMAFTCDIHGCGHPNKYLERNSQVIFV